MKKRTSAFLVCLMLLAGAAFAQKGKKDPGKRLISIKVPIVKEGYRVVCAGPPGDFLDYRQPDTPSKAPSVYVHCDEMPQFSGNIEAYIQQNLHYPIEAIQNEVEGRVIVKVIIDEAGQVTNPVIERGMDSSLDAEALRVVAGMPRWKPGKQNGVAVPVIYRIPVKFQLPE